MSWLPFAWVPVWFFGVDRKGRRRYVLAAVALSFGLVALGMLQTDGPARLWGDVSPYVQSATSSDWRNPWSPFVYHPWAGLIRRMAALASLPTGLWILHRLWRSQSVSVWMLAATTALVVVHGELLLSHAPGRLTLWTLPFFLVIFLVGAGVDENGSVPSTPPPIV